MREYWLLERLGGLPLPSPSQPCPHPHAHATLKDESRSRGSVGIVMLLACRLGVRRPEERPSSMANNTGPGLRLVAINCYSAWLCCCTAPSGRGQGSWFGSWIRIPDLREREVGERKGGKRHTERGGGEERRGEREAKQGNRIWSFFPFSFLLVPLTVPFSLFLTLIPFTCFCCSCCFILWFTRLVLF